MLLFLVWDLASDPAIQYTNLQGDLDFYLLLLRREVVNREGSTENKKEIYRQA